MGAFLAFSNTSFRFIRRCDCRRLHQIRAPARIAGAFFFRGRHGWQPVKQYSRLFTTRAACAVYNRQALSLLEQVHPYPRPYRSGRASVIVRDDLAVTPRNGKYSEQLLSSEPDLRIRWQPASVRAMYAVEPRCPGRGGGTARTTCSVGLDKNNLYSLLFTQTT